MGKATMNRDQVNRRDFTKLTSLAMGGIMAGSFAGCGAKTEKTGEAEAKTEGESPTDGKEDAPLGGVER